MAIHIGCSSFKGTTFDYLQAASFISQVIIQPQKWLDIDHGHEQLKNRKTWKLNFVKVNYQKCQGILQLQSYPTPQTHQLQHYYTHDKSTKSLLKNPRNYIPNTNHCHEDWTNIILFLVYKKFKTTNKYLHQNGFNSFLP